ncbi:hypothetical protein GALL_492480 [mine drainage metagenome]|uniref:Uncharacterized protein n=1 Tax=mine drainage metagenome TaxID=410659 RepID=A0A1J5PEE4_9ZZZZ
MRGSAGGVDRRGRLGDFLRPAAGVQPRQYRLRGGQRGARPRRRVPVASRVQPRQRLAGGDALAFVHQQRIDAARIVERQLHLPHVDVAVQLQRVGGALRLAPPGRGDRRDDHDGDDRQDQAFACRHGRRRSDE